MPIASLVTLVSRDFRWTDVARTLTLAVPLLSAACASTGAMPHPFPTPGGTSSPAPTAATRAPIAAEGYTLAGSALALRGAPYRNGGGEPDGFDCSGFTRYVFAQHGISLPREVREQFRIGIAVTADRLAAGDLIFFSTIAPGASHVGIAIGGDQFVHAPSSTGVVRVERLTAIYWSQRFIGARRIN